MHAYSLFSGAGLTDIGSNIFSSLKDLRVVFVDKCPGDALVVLFHQTSFFFPPPTIEFGSNNLTKIEADAFAGLTLLYYLLRHIQIEKGLPSSSPICSILLLGLEGNSLKTLPNDFFSDNKILSNLNVHRLSLSRRTNSVFGFLQTPGRQPVNKTPPWDL